MKNNIIDDLIGLIRKYPRQSLTCLPTPLYRLDCLSRELAGPDIFIKRDDLTGLALGGNKARKLEFIIADALQKGADTVITWGSLQSNWCLQLAAACRKYNLKPVLVLFQTYELPFSYEGNVLIEHLLGAEIIVRKTAEKGKSLNQEQAFMTLREVAEAERKKGRKPYLVSVGGSALGGHMEKPLGALAYFLAMLEIYEQTRAREEVPDWVIIASGSGGTQAGLLVGAKALGLKTRIAGICVSDKKEVFLPVVLNIARELVEMLELPFEVKEDEIFLFDDYLGAGYGRITPEVTEGIKYMLKTEGLVLDPVYTSKALIGMLDLVKKNYFGHQARILFIHTGGIPALFAFREQLLSQNSD